MKTALGSSPRRQSSVAPKSHRRSTLSPHRASSEAPVTRRLDFEQETSLQDTPLVNGSAERRSKRSSIYDLAPSPLPQQDTIMEESIIEEIIANGDYSMQEDSSVAGVGDDDATAEDVQDEESEVMSEPVRQPAKRGRKRKSDPVDTSTIGGNGAGDDVQEEDSGAISGIAKAHAKRGRKRKSDAIESSNIEESVPTRSAKKSAAAAQRGKGAAQPVTKGGRGRPKKATPPTEIEPSTASARDSADEDKAIGEPVEDPAPVAKRARGRPPSKAKAEATGATEANAAKQRKEAVFKKPKAISKPTNKEASVKKSERSEEQIADDGSAVLVDVFGRPIPRDPAKPEDAVTIASNMSRYGRGRQLLSVYRRTAAEDAPKSRHGRPIFRPINFWANEKAVRERDGTVDAVDRWINPEPVKPAKRSRRTTVKPKKEPTPVPELEEWEEDEPGCLEGRVASWPDPNENLDLGKLHHILQSNTPTDLGSVLAWSEVGMEARDVPGATFKYAKITQEDFLGCGIVELPPGGIKRPKNSRRMHILFFVATGAVEVQVHQNEFTIHRGGVFQVPRGEQIHFSLDRLFV